MSTTSPPPPPALPSPRRMSALTAAAAFQLAATSHLSPDVTFRQNFPQCHPPCFASDPTDMFPCQFRYTPNAALRVPNHQHHCDRTYSIGSNSPGKLMLNALLHPQGRRLSRPCAVQVNRDSIRRKMISMKAHGSVGNAATCIKKPDHKLKIHFGVRLPEMKQISLPDSPPGIDKCSFGNERSETSSSKSNAESCITFGSPTDLRTANSFHFPPRCNGGLDKLSALASIACDQMPSEVQSPLEIDSSLCANSTAIVAKVVKGRRSPRKSKLNLENAVALFRNYTTREHQIDYDAHCCQIDDSSTCFRTGRFQFRRTLQRMKARPYSRRPSDRVFHARRKNVCSLVIDGTRSLSVRKRKRGHETRVQRCAKQVLEYVGEETTIERLIREALGNNPDTSKALRLLLNQHKIKRCGGGGRNDPYLYKATPAGLRELQRLRTLESPQCNALWRENVDYALAVLDTDI